MDKLLENLEEKDRKMAEAILGKMEQLKKDAREGLMDEKSANERFDMLQKNMEQFKEIVEAKDYQAQIDEVTKELAKMKVSQKDGGKSFIDILKENLTPEKLQLVKKDSRAKIAFEVKAADNMSLADSTTGAIPQAVRLPGVSKKPENRPLIADLIPAIPVQSNLIEYVEEETQEGTPAFLIEQASFPLMDIAYKVADAKVKKVGAHIKITREMLSDVSFVLGEITNKLLVKIGLKADAKMLAGDEDANAEEWNGLVTVATAFDNAGFKVKLPNIFDVLSTAITQLINNLHVPDTILMNPSDVNAMKLTKNVNGEYVMPLLIMANGTTFGGLRIISNPLMTKGKFLIMDSSVINYYVREGIEIEMAYENDTDFIKDLVTVKGRMRAAFFVKNNDKDAIVYGDFDTAITAMTATT